MENIELNWSEIPDFLANGDEGTFVREGDREVEVSNMVGGRYLLWEGRDVAGQTNDIDRCVQFLKGN